jgi:hypothetical protein
MNLREAWKKLEHEQLEKPAAWEPCLPGEGCRSKHPALVLKRFLGITVGFSLTFLIIFIILIFLFNHWLIKLFIALVAGSYFFFFIYNCITLNRVKLQLKQGFDVSLKTALAKIHDVVFQSLRLQEKAALFIYPLSTTAGFMVGLSSGGNFEEDIQDSTILIILAVSIAVLTPASYFLARWMYKVSYEKYLDQLKKLIDEMDNPQ